MNEKSPEKNHFPYQTLDIDEIHNKEMKEEKTRQKPKIKQRFCIFFLNEKKNYESNKSYLKDNLTQMQLIGNVIVFNKLYQFIIVIQKGTKAPQMKKVFLNGI